MVEDVFGIIGTTLAGTFHVEEVIAEGGFGVVYRAEHVAFRAPVALKCLKIPGTISPSQSELFVENFREEAEILFHLSAQIPEVVRPLHADAMTLEDGTFVPYLAMEWIEGRPLDSIIIVREESGQKPLGARKVVKMLTPIAQALARAHHFQVPGGAVVSVTHCDLKPENILITERDSPVRAKILDFGIAKARDTMRQNVGRITASEESRPFTPSYGAPEQWVPKRYGQSGPWTDVWGLALTMVECLTGQPPIDGDMHAMMGTALDKSHRPTPRNEGAPVTDAVERVFEKALAVDPRDRYTTIEEFWSDLEIAVGAPSSFDRLRRRSRTSVGFDEEDSNRPRESKDPQEFDGLEIEAEAGEPEDGPAVSPPPASPPVFEIEPTTGRRHVPRSFGSFEEDDDDDDIASSHDTGSLAGMAVDSTPPPAEIDLDFGSRPPPRSSLTSSSPDLEVGRSGSHPVLSRSGTHPALTRSGTHPALTTSGALRERPLAGPGASVEEGSTLRARLKAPIILVGLGLGLTILDAVLAPELGGSIALGPIRFRWVAAALAAVGLILAFWNLLGERE